MGLTNLAVGWALSRLNERSTWVSLIGAACVKFGVTFSPAFDTSLVNAALAIMAIVGTITTDGPVVKAEKKEA